MRRLVIAIAFVALVACAEVLTKDMSIVLWALQRLDVEDVGFLLFIALLFAAGPVRRRVRRGPHPASPVRVHDRKPWGRLFRS